MTPILEYVVTITLSPAKEGFVTGRISREMLEVGRPVLMQYLFREVKSEIAKLPLADAYEVVSAMCHVFDSPRSTDEPVAEIDLLAEAAQGTPYLSPH